MTHDTLETAYSKAREAQRRGGDTITLALPAPKTFNRKQVDVASIFTRGADCGAIGWVVRKIAPDKNGTRRRGKRAKTHSAQLSCRLASWMSLRPHGAPSNAKSTRAVLFAEDRGGARWLI